MSLFFVRRGGHCCRGDLLGRTTFWIFFFSVACKKSLDAVACFLPGRAKDLSPPRYNKHGTLYIYRTVDISALLLRAYRDMEVIFFGEDLTTALNGVCVSDSLDFFFFISTTLYEFWLAHIYPSIVSSLAPSFSSSSLPFFSTHLICRPKFPYCLLV